MFTIITKPDCPWCDKAKSLLRHRDESFSEFSMGEYPIFRDFLKANDLHTAPQIFYKGVLIGGYIDLDEWFALDDLRAWHEAENE